MFLVASIVQMNPALYFALGTLRQPMAHIAGDFLRRLIRITVGLGMASGDELRHR